MTAARDALGVDVQVGDRVAVNAWGGPIRLYDVGRRANVIGFTARGLVRLDDGDPATHAGAHIASGRNVHASYLAVLRRDGDRGLEGNRDRA